MAVEAGCVGLVVSEGTAKAGFEAAGVATGDGSGVASVPRPATVVPEPVPWLHPPTMAQSFFPAAASTPVTAAMEMMKTATTDPATISQLPRRCGRRRTCSADGPRC